MRKTLLVLAWLLVCGLSRAQLPQGSWSGSLDVQGASLEVVFNFDDEKCTMDVPAQGAKGIRAVASLTDLGALHIEIAALNASFEGYRIGEKIIGTFSQYGMSFPLTLKPGIRRHHRPQTPQPPFPYATEEVSFSNGNAVLKGTLTLPQACNAQTPVLLMVTGSGLQDRDETVFEHRPFAVLADYLARRGVATLRYDDRGFGESTGDAVYCTTEDLKKDAEAGIALLRGRFERVGVLGHSEGGTIGLMLAAEGKTDFVVSLAGMVVSGRETLLSQNRIGLPKSGFDTAMTDIYCKALTESFDALDEGLPMPDADSFGLPDGLVQNLQAVQSMLGGLPYYRYFLKLDVSKDLGRINCPVLALNGTLDIQVEYETNLSALRQGLPAGDRHLVQACEGLNHLFQHGTTGDVSEYLQIEETFAPEVLALISEWLGKLWTT